MTHLLEMTVEFKDASKPPKAETILRAATQALKLIRAVEKTTKETKEPIPWEVSINWYRGRAIIGIDTQVKTPDDVRAVAEKAAQSRLNIPGAKP